VSKGILYYNRDQAYLEKLMVSIDSLREHWSGEITVVNEGPVSRAVETICNKYQARLIPIYEQGLPIYAAKVASLKYATHRYTIFLDLDTIVTGPLDAFWGYMENYEFVFTKFHDWKTARMRRWGRLEEWLGKNIVSDKLIERALDSPGINTGVFGFRAAHPFLKRWVRLTQMAEEQELTVTDESCAQALLPTLHHYIASAKWNVSDMLGDRSPENRVIHFHGGSTQEGIGKPCFTDFWNDRLSRVAAKHPELYTLSEEEDRKRNVILLCSLDANDVEAYFVMARMCVSSLLRTNEDCDIIFIHNNDKLLYSVARQRVTEYQIEGRKWGQILFL
jgi:hypothetical protein